MKTIDARLIDLGCGTNKHPGYFGIDITDYEGVDLVMDLRFTPLPFADGQLDGVFTSHFFEHLTFEENLYLWNEIYRCLRVGGRLEVIVPHAQSYGALTDLSHKTNWTEDTFGYFTPENKYFYSWFYTDPKTKGVIPLINKWTIHKNDNTPPYEYTTLGWTQVKLREVHAILEKLP